MKTVFPFLLIKWQALNLSNKPSFFYNFDFVSSSINRNLILPLESKKQALIPPPTILNDPVFLPLSQCEDACGPQTASAKPRCYDQTLRAPSQMVFLERTQFISEQFEWADFFSLLHCCIWQQSTRGRFPFLKGNDLLNSVRLAGHSALKKPVSNHTCSADVQACRAK